MSPLAQSSVLKAMMARSERAQRRQEWLAVQRRVSISSAVLGVTAFVVLGPSVLLLKAMALSACFGWFGNAMARQRHVDGCWPVDLLTRFGVLVMLAGSTGWAWADWVGR